MAKMSSKQIGDEMTNGGKGSNTNESQVDSNGNQIAEAFDATRMWPLLCFELSISVDQEERLIQAHKRYVNIGMISPHHLALSFVASDASHPHHFQLPTH